MPRREEDDNFISVGGWMWIMFVTALPCIGLVMMIVWAFVGNNQTRKNYFRAIFVWFFILVALFGILALLASVPEVQRLLDGWISKSPPAAAR